MADICRNLKNSKECACQPCWAKHTCPAQHRPAVYNLRLYISRFIRRVRIFHPVDSLHGQAFSELPGSDAGGCNQPVDIGIFPAAVISGHNNPVRAGTSFMFLKIALQEVCNIIAGADKCFGQCFERVEEITQYLVIGKNPDALRKAALAVNIQAVVCHALAKALITVCVCAGIMNVPDKAEACQPACNHGLGNLVNGAASFQQNQVAVQHMCVQLRHGV